MDFLRGKMALGIVKYHVATPDHVAGFGVVDQIDRAAAARLLALYCGDVTVALGRIVAQRIFANEPIGRPERDVGPAGERRQFCARGIAQLEHVNALRNFLLARDAQRHRVGWHPIGHDFLRRVCSAQQSARASTIKPGPCTLKSLEG